MCRGERGKCGGGRSRCNSRRWKRRWMDNRETPQRRRCMRKPQTSETAFFNPAARQSAVVDVDSFLFLRGVPPTVVTTRHRRGADPARGATSVVALRACNCGLRQYRRMWACGGPAEEESGAAAMPLVSPWHLVVVRVVVVSPFDPRRAAPLKNPHTVTTLVVTYRRFICCL
jgi:hypothetical protein